MIKSQENHLRLNHIYYISSVVKCVVIFTTLLLCFIMEQRRGMDA